MVSYLLVLLCGFVVFVSDFGHQLRYVGFFESLK